MKTVEISALAVSVLLDNLADMYKNCVSARKRGQRDWGWLVAAYEEAENALKAAQKGGRNA